MRENKSTAIDKITYARGLVNKETLYPHINNSELLYGNVGEYYETEVFGSLVGAKAELEIIATQIPDGLNLNDCKQEHNIKSLPRPNTFIRCNLSGYPTTSGNFDAIFEISAKEYANTVIQKFGIVIN